MPFARREPHLQNLNLYLRLSKLHSKYSRKRPAPTDDETKHELKRTRTTSSTSNNYIQLVANLRRGSFTADQKEMLDFKHQPAWKIKRPEIIVEKMSRCVPYKSEEKIIASENSEDEVNVVDEDDDDVSQYLGNFRKFCKEVEEKDKERARLASAEPVVEVQDLEDGEIHEEGVEAKNMAVCRVRRNNTRYWEEDGMDDLDTEILSLGTKKV